MGLLDRKVIIVTGAGRGVGRGIALLAAEEGAHVVVNDLGVSPGGDSEEEAPADAVVREIGEAGGSAVANKDDVSSWESAQKIIQCAMDNFGAVDGIVNNAGILRDVLFHKLEPKDFDDVIDVNLKGPFYISRAAAQHMREEQRGAFVHMTSTAALIGNMGQANYMASKAGLVGLSTSISLDMQKFGVISNCIAPFAWTRMVSTIPTHTPELKARVEGLKKLVPERIAPLAVALLSDEARQQRINGQIFGVRNNEIYLFSKHRPIKTMHTADGWTARSVLDRAVPAMEPDFLEPKRSGEIFTWEPV